MILEQKVALITGSGLGIGRVTTILFANKRAKVMVNYIKEKNGNQTVDGIKKSVVTHYLSKQTFQTRMGVKE